MSLTVLGDLTSSMSEANITEELDCGYYLWQVPGKSPAVRLSLDLVDRLGSESLAKFADLTSRGAEIGGILLGHTVDGPVKTVFVDSYEPIQCDYTDSAMFLLSEAAKVRLVERLYEVRTSYRHARLKYLPVGFFRTHARKGLVLDEKDVALMREYFPDPDSIFLLIKPFATKPSLGAIFVRSNGEFQIERTGQFPFKRAELAVRTPEFIVGTTVASNGASGSTEAAAPAEPVSARPPLLDDAQELPASPAPETLGAEERTVDDEQDPLKKVLRQILRNPAESKLFTSRAAEQDSTICVRIASLPGADSSYGPQGETGTFGGALKTVQFPEMPANGSRERTPEREVAGGNASAFGNGHGLNKSRRISARASRAEADQRRGQLWAFAAFGLIIVTVAGYFGLDAKQYRKPAADRTVTEDTKLNLTFQQQGKALILNWDNTSDIIDGAKEGVLHVRDGDRSQDLTLTPDQLHSGTILYSPFNKSARFQLEVADSNESRRLGGWFLRTGLPVADNSATDRNFAQKEPKAQKSESVQEAATRNVRTPPILVHSVLPAYRDAARSAHAWGLVSVQGVIGTDGRVKNAVAVSGPPALRDAAVDAVQKFVYQPATVGGRPTESPLEVKFNFVPPR